MKVTVEEQTDQRLVMRVKDVHPSFLNTLRRTLMADVPKMAIEDVTIYDNTSGLFDEVVAHRLGLLPIPTDLQAFVARDKCTCDEEGCVNCTILFTLSKEGPCTVYSGDLTPADARFKIKDARIPIVKLLEGQRVMLEAAAQLGDGTQHSKWSAVTACGYYAVPTVTVKDSPPFSSATYQDLQELAPEGTLSFEDGKVRVLDPARAYTLFKSLQKLHDMPNVELSLSSDEYVMTVETDGGLTAREAVKHALGILMEKLRGVESDVGDLKMEEPATAV